MKGSPSLRPPASVAEIFMEFVVEIIPITLVTCLLGFVARVIMTWCFATETLLLKLVLGVVVLGLGLMSLALGFIALLAIVEFVRDLARRK